MISHLMIPSWYPQLCVHVSAFPSVLSHTAGSEAAGAAQDIVPSACLWLHRCWRLSSQQPPWQSRCVLPPGSRAESAPSPTAAWGAGMDCGHRSVSPVGKQLLNTRWEMKSDRQSLSQRSPASKPVPHRALCLLLVALTLQERTLRIRKRSTRPLQLLLYWNCRSLWASAALTALVFNTALNWHEVLVRTSHLAALGWSVA